MRLSELSGREIVNINDGARLGRIGDADLVIEPRSGRIKRLLLPLGGHSFFRKPDTLEIPWSAIRRIGEEIIIIEYSPKGDEPDYLQEDKAGS